MPTAETEATEVKKLRRLIKGTRVAMLTTLSADGQLRSRPMATLDTKTGGEVWFFTRAGSSKADEIRDNQRVNLSYADARKDRYVSISGTASIVHDPARVKELWDGGLKSWFPLGKKDPDLVLLRVAIDQAEYWDPASARLVPFLAPTNGAAAGESPAHGAGRKLGLAEGAPAERATGGAQG